MSSELRPGSLTACSAAAIRGASLFSESWIDSSWSLKVVIFVSTYWADVRVITSFASASAAFSALPGCAATTLIVTSGAPVARAPGPDAPTSRS